jgi:hypothetical protein
MARQMKTNIAWIGNLNRARKAVSIERARSIVVLLHKRVDPATNALPKGAIEDVAKELDMGLQGVRSIYYECKKALGQYEFLEDYWEAGRPFKVRTAKKEKALVG